MKIWIKYKGKLLGPMEDGQISTALSRGIIGHDAEVSDNRLEWYPVTALLELKERQNAKKISLSVPPPPPPAPSGVQSLPSSPTQQSGQYSSYSQSDVSTSGYAPVQPNVDQFPQTGNFCTSCGAAVLPGAAICMKCGCNPTTNHAFCQGCGNRLNPGQLICMSCGVPVGGVGKAGKAANSVYSASPRFSNSTPLGALDCYLVCFKKYVDFSGRASRREFWFFCLFSSLIGLGINLFFPPIFGGIYSLAVALPNLAVQVRRLHDIGKSGFWLLILCIPLPFSILAGIGCAEDNAVGMLGLGIICFLSLVVCSIALLIDFCRRGTVGANQYGEDPYSNNTIV